MKSLTTLVSALAASPVPFTLLGSGTGRYVPLYLATGDQRGRFASVNAGNANAFFVGGGGLNAAFGSTLANAGAYLNLQTALYGATSPTATVASASYPATQPVRFAMVQRPATGQVFKNYEGTVFVDVFQPGTTPGGNADNYAMIYVCPPNGQGYASGAEFLTAVEATALNLVTAVARYNTQFAPAVPGLATIEIIRVFLFSSAIYLQAATTVAQVAQAVCSGLLDGVAAGPTGLKSIELPNGKGEYAAVAPGAPAAVAVPPPSGSGR